MNALAPPAPALRSARGGGHERSRPAPSLFDTLGGEPTLDELIAGVWEGLAAHRPALCPLCGGEMQPIYGAHAPALDDSGPAGMSSRTTLARPEQARQDAERAASSSGRQAGPMPEGGRCGECETTLQ